MKQKTKLFFLLIIPVLLSLGSLKDEYALEQSKSQEKELENPPYPPESAFLGRDIDLSVANASFIGETGGDFSGDSVAGAGDVNNDGYDDFLIGARRNAGGGTERGQTYLIFGGPNNVFFMDRDLSSANASFLGENDEDSSGTSVAGAGDVNNDGYDDILIGARGNDETAPDAGQTYLIFGNDANMFSMGMSLSNANASFLGEAQSDYSGTSVAGAGDVNNDGYDDFLIGANGYGSYDGQTYLIFGGNNDNFSMDMPLSNVNASFIGEGSSDHSGNSVAGAGDVNNDGYDDILIGAYRDTLSVFGEGQTYLIFGNDANELSMDMSLSNANASFLGEAGWDYSGISVSGGGDVNNDGYDDILIGAYMNDENGGESGQTYLIFGNDANMFSMDTPLSNVNASFIGANGGDYSGVSVAGGSDLNNDGYDDIIIGSYYADDGGTWAGKSYLMLGNDASMFTMDMSLANANASYIGENANDFAGYSVAGVGDVDNDGYDDILIGAYGNDENGGEAGQTYLFFGAVLPPSSFTLDTNTTLPDSDGMFWLNWSISFAADNYSLYWSTNPGVDTGDNLYVSELINNSVFLQGFNNGTYYFRMVANNSVGSTWSNEFLIPVLFPPTAFLLDTNTTLPDTDGMFWLNWSISTYADNYSIYWSTSPSVDTSDNLYVDDLVNDTTFIQGFYNGTYYFRMVANNSVGSTWSNELIITVLTPPGPFSLNSNTTLPDTDGLFWLNWSLSIGAENYSIYWSTSPSVDISDNLYIGDLTNNTIVITGFTSGTYYFRMVANNTQGGTWSNELTIPVLFPPGAFQLDTNTTLPDTDGIFWLNWSVSTDVDNYSIYWSTSPSVDTSDNLYVGDLVNETMLIQGFITGTYHFRIVANNSVGSTWSNELTIPVSLLPGAFQLDINTTLPDTDGIFWLNWSISTDANNYSIYWSTSTGVNFTDKLYVGGLTNYTMLIKEFTTGTYYFRIFANNSVGFNWSNELTITVNIPVDDPGEEEEEEIPIDPTFLIITLAVMGITLGIVIGIALIIRSNPDRIKGLSERLRPNSGRN